MLIVATDLFQVEAIEFSNIAGVLRITVKKNWEDTMQETELAKTKEPDVVVDNTTSEEWDYLYPQNITFFVCKEQ